MRFIPWLLCWVTCKSLSVSSNSPERLPEVKKPVDVLSCSVSDVSSAWCPLSWVTFHNGRTALQGEPAAFCQPHIVLTGHRGRWRAKLFHVSHYSHEGMWLISSAGPWCCSDCTGPRVMAASSPLSKKALVSLGCFSEQTSGQSGCCLLCLLFCLLLYA